MIVMPANNSKLEVGYLAGKYAGRLGHLYGPGSFRGPYPFLPYALDNGRFGCWAHGNTWDESEYLLLLEKAEASGQTPTWIVVPDVVGDRDGTLREWDIWAPRLARFQLAMAVQDGMTAADVPAEASVVFVGGTTWWKRRTLHSWCDQFKRVHVGRINTEKWLWVCHEAGVESCDGTGWFRGDQKQRLGLLRYLDRSSQGLGRRQRRFFA